ncbi:MAG: hypothetical protein L0154_07410 [Chloroflexi bacterium]|nr:hypothetical protein [Chloroflexota bacterium]
MIDDPQHDEMTNMCGMALMTPVLFFVAAVIVVTILVVNDILRIDAFTAALYIFGLQVLFLAMFSVVYVVHSNE